MLESAMNELRRETVRRRVQTTRTHSIQWLAHHFSDASDVNPRYSRESNVCSTLPVMG